MRALRRERELLVMLPERRINKNGIGFFAECVNSIARIDGYAIRVARNGIIEGHQRVSFEIEFVDEAAAIIGDEDVAGAVGGHPLRAWKS